MVDRRLTLALEAGNERLRLREIEPVRLPVSTAL